jgi:hypothetical protein
MNDYSDLVFMMGAMVLFSLFANNANDGIVRGSTLLTQVEVEYSAIAFGQTIIDEARSRQFDEVTVPTDPDEVGIVGNTGLLGVNGYPAGFTSPQALGRDTGETYPNLDDFDDYHDLRLVRESAYGDYAITAIVEYIDEDDFSTVSSSRTNVKRLSVTVDHPNLLNPIIIPYVKTYY